LPNSEFHSAARKRPRNSAGAARSDTKNAAAGSGYITRVRSFRRAAQPEAWNRFFGLRMACSANGTPAASTRLSSLATQALPTPIAVT
jgi:hypothetical protein